MLSKCKKCGKDKQKIGFKYYGKTKQFIDETGRLWKGKTCGECYKSEHKMLMRRLRNTELKEIECPVCSTKYEQKRSNQKFCSHPCRKKDLNKRKKIKKLRAILSS